MVKKPEPKKTRKPVAGLSLPTFRYVAPFIWIALTSTVFATTSFFLLGSFSKTSAGNVLSYYTAKAPNTTQSDFETQAQDARALKIEGVFNKFKCPLAGTGEYIVQKADDHNIPYWLVAAVSFQESGCGKKTPIVAGLENSYNAWGYGVWGNNVKTFADWEAGISALSNYFDVNFFSKGITDPCEIMRVYTPPSKGSWCEGVKYFGEMIQNFESE